MAKTVLRLTEKSASVKVTDAVQTISLATDLLKASEAILGTPTVSIYRVYATGNFDITRGGTLVVKSTSGQMMDLDFSQMECIENTNATSDIVITPATGVQVYVVLRKESGYESKIQPEQFGQYDNTASTTA